MRPRLDAALAVLLLLPAPAHGEAPCLPCHEKKTPVAVKVWRASAHGRERVGCKACHGTDHDKMVKGQAPVRIQVCGTCHSKQARAHLASRHGKALNEGWGCTRKLSGRDKEECRFCHREGDAEPRSRIQCAVFLKQSSAMGEVGCNRCHQVQQSCAACHTSHGTSKRIARNPNVCAKCHMGPDHPQWEMWQTSLHGTLHAASGGARGAACQDCHMVGGDHDVSRGLTMTPLGQLHPPATAKAGRERMLKVCQRCHTRRLAERELSRGDTIRAESVALLERARAIIRDLADRNLLDPMPDKRPPHPHAGQSLVLGPHMLYEDISLVEQLYYKMKSFDLAKTVKGAYHQNPAYAHWYGNAALKMSLVEIRSEASRLRGRAARTAAAPSRKRSDVEQRLRLLKRQRDRGAITEARYREAKRRLLEAYVRD